MSERKVLNKYYPPDFDPSKIPRMKLAKNRQYTVRLMAPFNMRCVTCGEYIYKGKKFNARKEDVEDQTYLGIRIYRFYIKCTRCLQEISFKTDPQNTDYEIEAGATRNFMALKLAEEQAKKEMDELKEEEATNPMKLLENRTQQSRNEIDLLESLEELRDLNRRQQNVDYDEMLMQYNTTETEQEMAERLERNDEEYIKQVKFHSNPSKGTKRVAAEEIIEIEDLAKPNNQRGCHNDVAKTAATISFTCPKRERIDSVKSIGASISIGGLKNSMNNLVKRKTIETVTTKTIASASVDNDAKEITSSKATNDKPSSSINALSLLSGYNGDSDSSESD